MLFGKQKKGKQQRPPPSKKKHLSGAELHWCLILIGMVFKKNYHFIWGEILKLDFLNHRKNTGDLKLQITHQW